MTPEEAREKAIEAAARALYEDWRKTTSASYYPSWDDADEMRREEFAIYARIAIAAYEAALWQQTDRVDMSAPPPWPDICLVAYSNGHVTAAEYSEHLSGGPDEHMTWDAHVACDQRDPLFHDILMGYAWPVAWRPLPQPPEKTDED